MKTLQGGHIIIDTASYFVMINYTTGRGVAVTCAPVRCGAETEEPEQQARKRKRKASSSLSLSL